MPLEDRHYHPVYPSGFAIYPPFGPYPFRRKYRYADEAEEPMFARRRETKKLIRIARMLRELDSASAARPAPVRRRSSRAAIVRS
jgi:hypothetical protein